MSRCFPFPPPGYEKKPRTDDVDTLLIKDTHKEKKHKKEKKDKKREGKEKKDKESSKDKRREKKERKEKHKERKKDKDKSKTDEKKIDEQPGVHNRQKHGDNSQQDADIKDAKHALEFGRRIGDEERGRRNQMVEDFNFGDQRKVTGMGRMVVKNGDKSQQNADIKDEKLAVEFGRRSADEERGRRNQMVEDFSSGDQRKVIGTSRMVVKNGEHLQQDAAVKDAKFALEFSRRNQLVEDFTASDQRKITGKGKMIEKNGENTKPDADTKDTRVAVDLSRRAGDRRDQRAEDSSASDQKKFAGMARVLDKNNDNRIEGKVYMDKKGNEKKTDRQGIKDGMGSTMLPSKDGVGSTMPPNIKGVDQRRAEGMTALMEKDAEKKVGRKEKNKGKDGGDKRKDQQKDKNGEKKSKGKDKHRDKEKGKIEDVNQENLKQDRLRENHKEPENILNIRPLQIPVNIVKSVGTEENIRKRKDPMMNGFLHDNDARPNKLLKPTNSSHPFNGNGRKFEPCQTAIQRAPGAEGGINNLKVDIKEHKVNGLVEAHPSSIISRSASFANVQSSENGIADTGPKEVIEPPHPDSKYLSQILSVPKMEEWSEFDDQEWLFSSCSTHPKKSNLVLFGVDETPQVWDKVLQIESADVLALPYVIPY